MISPSESVRKRRRPAFSCTECRRRKVRCDRTKPCNQCTAHNLDTSCTYEETHRTVSTRGVSRPSPIGSGQRENRTQGISEEPHPISASLQNSTTSAQIKGTVSKSRVFGHGHWMSTFSLMEGLPTVQPVGDYYDTVFQPGDHGPVDQIAEKVAQCKRLSRDVKKQRPSRRCLPADIHRFFPNRQVMDELVELYFTTFESCHRILHFPSFMVEYESCMNHPGAAEGSFLVMLLLLMTAAGTLHGDANVRKEMAAKAHTWIHISQTWLSAPLEKDRVTLKGIQINCLLLLSRLVNRVGADLIWISVGSLVRMAMQLGLHQDPNRLGEMSVLQKEVRRRLWYTILEMNVQTALDSGTSPMIVDGDYNTHPPSNISDHDLDDTIRDEYRESRAANPTQISFQALLASSIPLRLHTAGVINSLQEELSYDQVLDLGNKLASVCRDAANTIDEVTSTGGSHPQAQFASSYCSHLLRRFPLCLHFRYAVRAKTNPRYYYSQKVALEAALDLVSLLDDDLYSHLLLTGGGMFRDIITRASLLIFLELTPESEADTSIFAKKRDRARQEPLLQDARRVVRYSKDRMWRGETNVKVYVYTSMMMAQAEARLDGSSTKDAVSNALNHSLDACHNILKTIAADNPDNGMHPDLEPWASNSMVTPPMGLDDDFDFLNNENLNFDLLGSNFPAPWTGQTYF